MSKYYPPEYESEKFNCMHCKVYAHQRWSTMRIEAIDGHTEYAESYENVYIGDEQVEVSLCAHCEAPTLWAAGNIIYPPQRTAPQANSDLPDDVKAVYDEAAAIANQSPRAGCALLRFAIELLLKELGETGSINDGINNLVKKGLDVRVQKSLDTVRVTGNNAVHPGEIGFDDTTDVNILFQLINIIANVLITQPKQIQEAYNNLPDNARKAIKKRDSKT